MSDIVKETLEEFELKGLPKDDTLEASLKAYTKPNLMKIAEMNDFEVMKSWNKDQMIEVISEGLRSSLDERLSAFDREELVVLQDMLEAKKEEDLDAKVFPTAVEKGLLYASTDEDELVLSMPAEFEEKLAEVIQEDNQEKEEDRTVTQLLEAAEAASEESDQVVTQAVNKNVAPVNRNRTQSVQQRIVGEKLGRNDLCHCGSGKKYKKCHWSQDQRA